MLRPGRASPIVGPPYPVIPEVFGWSVLSISSVAKHGGLYPRVIPGFIAGRGYPFRRDQGSRGPAQGPGVGVWVKTLLTSPHGPGTGGQLWWGWELKGERSPLTMAPSGGHSFFCYVPQLRQLPAIVQPPDQGGAILSPERAQSPIEAAALGASSPGCQLRFSHVGTWPRKPGYA